MINNQSLQHIAKLIQQTINQPFSITDTRSVAGGCINSAYILQGKTQCFFIKLNHSNLLSMFEAEFKGLQEMEQSATVRVPHPIVSGVIGESAFLVLEKVSLCPGNSESDEQLGHQLAALHQQQHAFFGWHQNNTIGSTEQINHSSENWISFWHNQRLGFQLTLAEKNGYSGKLIKSGEQLSEALDRFFTNHNPQPSLLHGDLWSGNAAVTDYGEAIIYDPACYYGDRETDIAMTELFGGFSSSFYVAYNESYPLDSGYRVRKTLYNLYHILNHLNLFGQGYLHQAQNMIDSLLAEL